MLAKLIRRIKCCSVQEILMIVSIIMLLIVIANRTSAGIKARSASSGQITQHQKQAAPIIRKSKCSTDFKRNDFLKKTKRTHWVRFVHLNSLIESCVFLYLWNSPFDTFL